MPIYNSILEISASTLNLKTSISCNLFIFSRQESVRIWLVSLKHVLLIFNLSHLPQTFGRTVKKGLSKKHERGIFLIFFSKLALVIHLKIFIFFLVFYLLRHLKSHVFFSEIHFFNKKSFFTVLFYFSSAFPNILGKVTINKDLKYTWQAI